jgi:hypothetical protein
VGVGFCSLTIKDSTKSSLHRHGGAIWEGWNVLVHISDTNNKIFLSHFPTELIGSTKYRHRLTAPTTHGFHRIVAKIVAQNASDYTAFPVVLSAESGENSGAEKYDPPRRSPAPPPSPRDHRENY